MSETFTKGREKCCRNEAEKWYFGPSFSKERCSGFKRWPCGGRAEGGPVGEDPVAVMPEERGGRGSQELGGLQLETEGRQVSVDSQRGLGRAACPASSPPPPLPDSAGLLFFPPPTNWLAVLPLQLPGFYSLPLHNPPQRPSSEPRRLRTQPTLLPGGPRITPLCRMHLALLSRCRAKPSRAPALPDSPSRPLYCLES